MTYNAAVFDLDGTLLNTLEDLADSMNSVLLRYGLPGHGLEAYRRFVGDGMENLVRRALPEDLRSDPNTVARGLSSMREEYGRRWRQKTRPYDGIPDLLDTLTRRGLKMAILSNKPDDFTRQVVEQMLSRWRFEVSLGERPSVPRKPDPAGALEIAERLGISPPSILYLGDTDTDMKTANAAGMYAVGVLWGFREAQELIASGAKTLIEKPGDLLRLL